ncbi:non-ribosomal peptide synthetase, partial [Nonomuraea sp. RK-328]|nr:non-ribosomal peptide synthetase [Nonomuraea sp. RK-328]
LKYRAGICLIAAALRSGNVDVVVGTAAGSVTVHLPLGEQAGFWLDEVDRTLAVAGADPVLLTCDADWHALLTSWHARHPRALVGDLVAVGSGLVSRTVDPGGRRQGSLMSEGIRATVLDGFCRGRAPALNAPARCVQDIFADLARKHPDRTALIAADGMTTFGELEVSSRLLAHRLRRAGAGPDTVIAVLAPRDSSLIVAMLAVLRAGGAFLLVDPNDPPELSKYKVETTVATVLWRDERCARGWDGTDAMQVVTGLDGWGADADDLGHLPEAALEDLAYVIFTSGSTGRPKGVQIEHGGLTEHALTQLASIYSGWGEDAPLLIGGAAPVTFDAFIDQVLPMLVFGHTLVLLDDRQRTDPESFTRPRDGVALDVVDCTPSQLSALVGQGLLDQLYPPKLIVFAGEKPSSNLWSRLRASSTRAISIYGATECSIGSLHADVESTPEVSLGLPEGSARAYILDDQKRLLPPGIAGEIYLAGPGVARGYVGHSNEAFSDDPFGDSPSGRMYRTGDLGRIGPSGHFEFLGRSDDQIKIRGFRVEPGEIESALEAVPGIEQAVVVPAPYETPYTHLVAFLVKSSGGPDWQEARERVARKLPDHMVPARAEFWDELPLTRNGKADRGALRRHISEYGKHRQPTAGERPANATEELILGIWTDVLDVPGAGVTDDFLELGGHSLAAMEIVSRLRAVLPQRIPMDLALRARTVRDLAEAVKGRAGRGESNV